MHVVLRPDGDPGQGLGGRLPQQPPDQGRPAFSGEKRMPGLCNDLRRQLAAVGKVGEVGADQVQVFREGLQQVPLHDRDPRRIATALPACPLMHGTGLFITLSTLSGGGTVVLIDRPGLEPHEVWSAVERDSVQVLTIVGDAFARPLLAALDEEPDRWNLDSLRAITSSGVT